MMKESQSNPGRSLEFVYCTRKVQLHNADDDQVHIRQQLAYDIWWLIAAAFLICVVEHGHLRTNEPGFSIFSIMFETVSAYGNIGLSLGVPYQSYSFSGAWHVLAKLILLAVMIRGTASQSLSPCL